MYESYFVLSLVLVAVNSELFTSVSHLYSSVEAGRALATALRKYTRVFKEGIKMVKLKSISYKMEEHSLNTLKDPYRYIANPIGAFLFIKLFTLDWERNVEPILEENVISETDLSILKEIREYLPTHEDLEGVASALFRLQDTYKLNATALAEGFIYERYIHRLSAEDCYQLGRLAYKMKKFNYVYIWMEISLEKERREEKENVLGLFDYGIHGRELAEEILRVLNLTNEQLIGQGRTVNREEKYSNISRSREDHRNVNTGFEEDTTFNVVCRGEDVIKVRRRRRRLKCGYHNNKNNPLLVLQPAKEEVLHLSPKIVLYHDFISDVEIEEIKRVSMPLLETSEINRNGKTIKSDTRISKNIFLETPATAAELRIQKRIEAVTGLSMEESESLQVANYGIAGHFTFHSDYFDITGADNSGNRIATWLNYMSDVEGGATVFPQLGVRILPKKGAAAFWYNLYRNGSPHRMTIHGACPVIIGSKWVATYWISEKGQELKRPCSTNPEE